MAFDLGHSLSDVLAWEQFSLVPIEIGYLNTDELLLSFYVPNS